MAPGRQWGFVCPEDGGVLLELKGAAGLYCPNNGHNPRPKTHRDGPSQGSPAFFDRATVKEGYGVAKTDTPSGTGLSQKQIDAMKAAAAEDPASDAAAEAAVNKPTRARAAKTETEGEAKAPARSREPKDCLCGCGGQTKGGRFLPGHDAKYHSALRQAEGGDKAKAEAKNA